jgi:hypothetical protein
MATDDSESWEKKVTKRIDDKPSETPTGTPINSRPSTIAKRKREFILGSLVV